MNKLFTTALMIALPVLAPAAAIAQACSKQSPSHTVALLELYTSQGCDSCPPANKFVGGLHTTPSSVAGLTPEQVVPLALHVDYWDYIGWKDVFARRLFTDRQRWLSNVASSNTVYTPEIFVGGKELRNWRGDVPATVQQINRQPARADIGIALGKVANGSLPVTVNAAAAQKGNLFVALYETGLSTDIKAGENHGVTLKEDYVVRDWIGPIALSGDTQSGAMGKATKAMVTQTFAITRALAVKNLGVAAFVQTDQGQVLQALALPLCGG